MRIRTQLSCSLCAILLLRPLRPRLAIQRGRLLSQASQFSRTNLLYDQDLPGDRRAALPRGARHEKAIPTCLLSLQLVGWGLKRCQMSVAQGLQGRGGKHVAMSRAKTQKRAQIRTESMRNQRARLRRKVRKVAPMKDCNGVGAQCRLPVPTDLQQIPNKSKVVCPTAARLSMARAVAAKLLRSQ